MKRGKQTKSLPSSRKQRVSEPIVATVRNRRGRRAAKAQQRNLFASPEPEDLPREIWAGILRHQRRTRAERQARWAAVSDAQLQQMALELAEQETTGIGGDWFLPLLVDAVPRWAARHYSTPPDERVKRAHELGDVIAFSQGAAAICDPDAVGTEKPGALAEVFNAIAEGLGIGAFCPGGASFAGLNWRVEGTQLRVTNRHFCACYPVDDPHYWSNEPCSNFVEAVAEAVRAAQ